MEAPAALPLNPHHHTLWDIRQAIVATRKTVAGAIDEPTAANTLADQDWIFSCERLLKSF
jgi:hypothetical protein